MKIPSLGCKIILLIIVVILGILSIFFLGNDNVIEQGAESFIKSNTGIEVDLSPNENSETQ